MHGENHVIKNSLFMMFSIGFCQLHKGRSFQAFFQSVPACFAPHQLQAVVKEKLGILTNRSGPQKSRDGHGDFCRVILLVLNVGNGGMIHNNWLVVDLPL